MRKFHPLMILATLALVQGTGCQERSLPAEKPKSGLDKVTLALNWYPEAEHGGFYAALVKGYYKQEGLDVTILPGGPDSPVLQLVAQQQAMFGVTNADNILFGRAQQAPVVALMAPMQNSPRCLIVHEKSGIKSFEDLHDLTIAMSPGAAFAEYMKKKLPLVNVRIVPYGGSVAPFLADENYAQQGYVFSEPYVARKGGDPRVLMLSDLGFNPYTSILISSEEVLRKRPDVVQKMVAASVRGWIEYIHSPDEANRLIHQRNPKMDLATLDFGAKAIQPLVVDDLKSDEQIGQMTRARWRQLADQLIETGQIAADKVDVDKAFTTKFLKAGP